MTDEDVPSWIATLAKLSQLIGMNPTQTRWRLIRWNERRKQPKSERAPIIERVGEKSGFSVSTLLALAMMATYARVWVAQGGGFKSPSPTLLFELGGQFRAAAPDEYWRWLTAIFLHAGVMHILFNLVALAQIGPQLEEVYGRTMMLFIFIVTGIAGNIATYVVWLHPNAVGIGASGGICGLIGLAVGYGQRLNTTRGLALRNEMLRWLAYTIIFGFAFGADNVAHTGGAVVGAAFGYFVRPVAFRKLRWLYATLGVIGVLASIAAVVIIVTRSGDGKDLYTIDMQALICSITGTC